MRPTGRAAEALARTERRRIGLGGNALRAAVLGANDGLVSNLSLVMGVAGAELSGRTILVTGIAGLLAGALSMAMGEWISVQSSRELYAHQIEVERLEIATMPELETEELALIYRAKGVPDRRGPRAGRADHGRRGRPRSTRWPARNSASTPTSSAARPSSPRSPRSCPSRSGRRCPSSRSRSSPAPPQR